MKVKVEYLYNSGFTIETQDNFIVIDYYKGDLKLPNKKTTFFVSHGHMDHFNQEIFQYKEAKFVLSDDIRPEDFQASTRLSLGEDLIFVHEGDLVDFNGIRIQVFGSTDLGSSFLLGLDGINIFHSGDLNWWAWNDMGPEREAERQLEYCSEIDKVQALDLKIDLAFVPVDPRLGENYYLAGDYFIRTLKPVYFFPMHFGDNYDFNRKFVHNFQTTSTHIPLVDRPNQVFKLDL